MVVVLLVVQYMGWVVVVGVLEEEVEEGLQREVEEVEARQNCHGDGDGEIIPNLLMTDHSPTSDL